MDAPGKPLAADLSPAESRKWMGRLLIAVVLGVAIWNFIAALTSAVVLPGLARVMETDSQSPLSLGKGDFNVPVIFAAVLELCFAAIVALGVSSWSRQRPQPARRKSSSVGSTAGLSIASPAPVREFSDPVSPAASVQPAAPRPAAAVAQSAPPVQAPAPPPKPMESEKPVKPKAPKEVYYNLVGEPVDPDE